MPGDLRDLDTTIVNVALPSALASALCGAAQTPGQLIAARALQGIAAAALAPQVFVIIQAVFPRDRLGAAYGVISCMVGLAAVSGPTLGGVLTTDLSWRWVFYVNLPIAAAGIAGVAAVASTRATSLTFAPVLLVAGLGMGAIFAPLLAMAVRAAPPPLAGAASGVINVSRQLGATLGGAVTGAVLAGRLATAMHAQVTASAHQLAAQIPHGTPPR